LLLVAPCECRHEHSDDDDDDEPSSDDHYGTLGAASTAASSKTKRRRRVPLLSEAEIERIVYEGPSRKVVDLGRKNRFFCKALRRATQLRDRRCVNPVCTIPSDECHVDHDTTPWVHDGRTDQNNGGCRCARHNRSKGTKPPTTSTTPTPMTPANPAHPSPPPATRTSTRLPPRP
jgi:hypothetical protein